MNTRLQTNSLAWASCCTLLLSLFFSCSDVPQSSWDNPLDSLGTNYEIQYDSTFVVTLDHQAGGYPFAFEDSMSVPSGASVYWGTDSSKMSLLDSQYVGFYVDSTVSFWVQAATSYRYGPKVQYWYQVRSKLDFEQSDSAWGMTWSDTSSFTKIIGGGFTWADDSSTIGGFERADHTDIFTASSGKSAKFDANLYGHSYPNVGVGFYFTDNVTWSDSAWGMDAREASSIRFRIHYVGDDSLQGNKTTRIRLQIGSNYEDFNDYINQGYSLGYVVSGDSIYQGSFEIPLSSFDYPSWAEDPPAYTLDNALSRFAALQFAVSEGAEVIDPARSGTFYLDDIELVRSSTPSVDTSRYKAFRTYVPKSSAAFDVSWETSSSSAEAFSSQASSSTVTLISSSFRVSSSSTVTLISSATTVSSSSRASSSSTGGITYNTSAFWKATDLTGLLSGDYDGWWYTYDDSGDGGNSSIVPEDPGTNIDWIGKQITDNCDGASLCATMILGDAISYPYVDVAFNFYDPAANAAMTGKYLCFSYTSNQALRLNLRYSDDNEVAVEYNKPGWRLPKATTVTTWVKAFSSGIQETGWGTKIDPDDYLDSIQGVEFKLGSDSSDAGLTDSLKIYWVNVANTASACTGE
ncbi:MAG TPA: hypothetical protein VLM37_03615 [Fibrobacteraceae bacterium]|nr:hypothetical protein [Fibrobacteraceae bacterium]